MPLTTELWASRCVAACRAGQSRGGGRKKAPRVVRASWLRKAYLL
jgi:hypothetical protein